MEKEIKNEIAIVNFLFRMSSSFFNLDDMDMNNIPMFNDKMKKEFNRDMDLLEKFCGEVSTAIYNANSDTYNKFLEIIDTLNGKIKDDNEDVRQLKLILIKMFDALEILKKIQKKTSGKERVFVITCIRITERFLNRKYLKSANIKYDYLQINSKFIPIVT